MTLKENRRPWGYIISGGLLALNACSSAPTRDPDEMQKTLNALNAKIQILEGKLDGMTEKFEATRQNIDLLVAEQQKQKQAEVVAQPSQNFGATPKLHMAPDDPEVGFINDDAVQDFRKAIITYQGEQYPEAILAFSGFLEKFPDHPLAGSAQFYIGRSYQQQKQYKLATQEFQRVLTSYDRSTHISDTLREIAFAEDQLKMTDEAAKHRQVLSSVFPQSPAAWAPTPTVPTSTVSTTSDPQWPTINETPKPEQPVAAEKPQAPENPASKLDPPPTAPVNTSSALDHPPTAPLVDSEKAPAKEL